MESSVRCLVLPPGKLGLELEAASSGTKGLKVRGWNNPVFQLSSLPTGTVLRSIDGLSVETLDFLVAVNLLRDSKKRVLEVYSRPTKDEFREENACIGIGKQISISLQQQNLNGSFADENQNNRFNTTPLVDRGMHDDNSNASSFFDKEHKEGSKVTLQSPSKINLVPAPNSLHPPGYVTLRSPLRDMSANILGQCNQSTSGASGSIPQRAAACGGSLTVSIHQDIYTEEYPVNVLPDASLKKDELALTLSPATLAGSQRQQILDLKAEQREADAKIMLLKYQMGKMKKTNIVLPIKPEPVPTVLSVQTEVLESLLLHRHKFCSVLADLTIREHQIDLSVISQPLQESVHELCPRESRDVGLQCTLLPNMAFTDARKASQMEAEMNQQGRLIQRLKLQLRANVEAQINMHELASFKEVGGDKHMMVVNSVRQMDSGVQSDLSEYDSDGSASCNFIGMNVASERLLQAELDLDGTQDSPVHATAMQAIAINYASPMPLVDKIVKKVVAVDDTEINFADSSTLADILDTIEKSPERQTKTVVVSEHAVSDDIDVAWTRWARNSSKPADMGLSPASFKDHLHRLRGANTLMRDDISRFRETLKRLSR